MEAIKSYQMRLMLLTEAVMRSLLGNFLSHFCNFSQRVPKVYFLDTAKFANDSTFADKIRNFRIRKNFNCLLALFFKSKTGRNSQLDFITDNCDKCSAVYDFG